MTDSSSWVLITIRLFKTTIMVVEYNFPRIPLVITYIEIGVSNEITIMTKLMIAVAAVKSWLDFSVLDENNEEWSDRLASLSQRSKILVFELSVEFVSREFYIGKAVDPETWERMKVLYKRGTYIVGHWHCNYYIAHSATGIPDL